MQRKIVIGFFDTLFWARRFRRALEAKRAGRMTAVPQFEFTMADDASPAGGLRPESSLPSPSLSPYQQPPSVGGDGGYFDNLNNRPQPPPPLDTEGAFRSRANSIQKTPVQSRANSIQASPIMSPTRGGALQSIPLSPTLSPTHSPHTSPHTSHAPVDPAELNWQLASALNLSRPSSPSAGGPAGTGFDSTGPAAAGPSGVSRSSTVPGSVGRQSTMPEGGGHRSRQNSDVSAQDVLEVLDNSIWGESIRKSFTVKRPGR